MYPACQEASRPERRPLSFIVFFVSVLIHTLLVVTCSCGLAMHVTDRVTLDGQFIIDISISLLSLTYLAFGTFGSLGKKKDQIYASVTAVTVTSILSFIYHFDPPDRVNRTMMSIRTFTCLFGTLGLALVTLFAHKDFEETRIVGAGEPLRLFYKQRNRFLTTLLLEMILIMVLALMAITLDNGVWCTSAIALFALIQWSIGRTAALQESHRLVHLFLAIQMLGRLWIPIQILLTACVIHCYGHPVSQWAVICIAIANLTVSLKVHMQLLKVHRNFGYGLIDPGNYSLASLVAHRFSSLLFKILTLHRFPLSG